MEHTLRFLLVVASLSVAMVTAAIHNDKMLRNVANAMNNNNQVNVMTQERNGDSGHLDPCETTDPKFTLTWTPGTIKLGESIKIQFSMTPTVSLSKGTVSITIWLPDYDDPIYEVTKDFTCDNIHKWMPSMCPFEKGKRIDVQRTVPVNPALPLPGGEFKVKMKVTNDKNQLFACIKGNVYIANDYDY